MILKFSARSFWTNFNKVEVLPVTSQFLLRGHKMLNFLSAFFLKISETLKVHIFGTETDINKQKKLSFRFLAVFHISQ